MVIINHFDEYYMSLIEITDFNALIDNKTFFDLLVKYKQEAYENFVKYQEMMTVEQEIYWIICIIKIIINSLVEIYQCTKIPVFLKKLILQEY